MRAGPVAALPAGIGREHQRLARPRDRIGARQPAEVGRDQHAVRRQDAAQFGERARRRRSTSSTGWRSRRRSWRRRTGRPRRRRRRSRSASPSSFALAPRRLDLAGSDVDAADDRAAARELARDQAGAGAEIEHALARPADAERGQDVEQALRRPGTMRGVVGRGPAPVDGAAAVDRARARAGAHRVGVRQPAHDAGQSAHIRSGCFMRPASASASSPQPQK